MDLILQGIGGAIAKLASLDPDVMNAVIAGFGAVISEVGASQMVGCNVKGDTRILTTAITLETSKGEFGSAFALAFILLGIIFVLTAVTTFAQQRRAT